MRTHILPATPERQPALEWERRHGVFGGREIRTIPLAEPEIRDSGAGDGQFTIRGHAAVYDKPSLDLGGFTETIARGAFDRVLAAAPDVWAVWDHDTRYVLARTANKTLELRSDPQGLHYWARVAPTSYSADLRVLMERGDVNQASFAFTVAPGGDEWRILDDGETVERTIHEVGGLFDVTVTAMGAYPQTDSSVVRGLIRQAHPDLFGTMPCVATITNSSGSVNLAPFGVGAEIAAPTPVDDDVARQRRLRIRRLQAQAEAATVQYQEIQA